MNTMPSVMPTILVVAVTVFSPWCLKNQTRIGRRWLQNPAIYVRFPGAFGFAAQIESVPA